MTEREKQILTMIRKNPMISQQEIADNLGITRSSTSVHITNLIKKGLVKGRGYIVDEGNYVTIIGAANIDIHGFTTDKLIYEDSNPGNIKISCGGVARNIAENLARMDVSVKLITALGEDMYGRKITEESKLCGIDIRDSLVLKDSITSMYMSIMDEDGDMKLALCDAEIVEKISIDFLKNKHHILSNSKIIVLDTGLKKEVIEYVITTYKNIPVFLDPVSIKRSIKVKNLLGYFDTIKLNRHEAEYLSDMSIISKDDLVKAGNYFISKGVKNVFITLGSEGVYFRNINASEYLSSPKVHVINATGAGDSFMAGLVYSRLDELSLHDSAVFSMGAAILALSHENTINPTISIESIQNKIRELKIC
ncbi:MAG: winged helix-turn-helix transcriptional regulator [Clostridiales bacterium]|nr:winged helix-turn-helix transcriptional regulator [Clostridiales bacterium]